MAFYFNEMQKTALISSTIIFGYLYLASSCIFLRNQISCFSNSSKLFKFWAPLNKSHLESLEKRPKYCLLKDSVSASLWHTYEANFRYYDMSNLVECVMA